MELKSNIRIKSNLYIRSTADGSFSFADEDYIAQITSRTALRALMERAAKSGTELKLSDLQKKVLDPRFTSGNTSPFGGEMPAVTPISSSSAAAAPMPEPPTPKPPIPEPPIPEPPTPKPPIPEPPTPKPPIPEPPTPKPPIPKPSIPEPPILELSIPEPPVSEPPIPKPSIQNQPEIQLKKLNVGLDEFREINSGEVNSRIIESGLDAKVILDSVNYSEKIHIAAERIAFILNNAPGKRVLVICGTDIAAERIKRRVSDKLSNGSHIDMLDVFAAKYLAGIGESAARITALSENEKIAMFSEKMRPGDFAAYDFCLISDLDELVAEHVKVVLKILVLLKCGFLLLSDKRRAVLKYGDDSGYCKNVGKLRDVLSEKTQRLFLGSAKHPLSDEIDSIMSAMTEGKPSNNACKVLLEKMESAEISALSSANGETIVLCKDGGSAEYVSFALHKNNILHAVLRGDKPTPVRQLADLLWDNHEKIIGRDSFIKRFIARCGSDESSAEKYFNKLCTLTEHAPSEGLNLAKLAEVISLGGVPLYILNISNERLAVAEIGSPCGRVFNKVYIADSDFDNSTDGKLLYLAAAGRTEPPSLLKLGGISNSVCNANDRWVHIDKDGKAAFGAGHPGDIDLSSFISGNVGDAVRKQAYISKNVKPGDSVTLKLNGKVYDIVHNSTVIGKTSAAFSENLASEFDGQRYFDPLPETIVGIYVTDVTTVVSCRDPSEYEGIISPQFRDHRFWYGVELSGFGKSE